MMLAGTTPAILLAELHLPPGFEALDPLDLPTFYEGDEALRIEIVDAAGIVTPWQWADRSIDWHNALGWRIAPDGLAQPCDGCGRLTRVGYSDGLPGAQTWNPLCHHCDADGYD